MEERGGDFAAAGADGDAKQLVPRAVPDRKQHCLGDLVDECDVLAFGRPVVVDAAHGGAFDVAAGIVAQQVVDGPNPENLVEETE